MSNLLFPVVIKSLAQKVFSSLRPIREGFKDNGDLENYINSIGEMTKDFELLARDDADGNVGWSIILDADRLPVQYLPWLAQIVGVTLPTGMLEDDQRAYIKSTDGWKRGTPNAIKNAPIQYLTGNKTVILIERTPDPYSFTVMTLTSETPDQVAVLKALVLQKPAGLTMNYILSSGQTYETIFTRFPTYQSLYDAYRTYQELLSDSAHPTITDSGTGTDSFSKTP